MAKYLNETGLAYFWGKIKANFASKDVATQAANGLMSAQDKIKLDGMIDDKYSGHGVLFIGDSYTYGTGASDHLSGDTKRFSSILASLLEMTEYNYGVGSTGFCDPGSSGQNMPFPTQVLTAADQLSQVERNDIRLVIIAGGINDVNEGATYSGEQMMNAAATTVQNAHDNFPNADIIVFPILWKGQEFDYRAFSFAGAIAKGVAESGLGVAVNGCWTWNFGLAENFTNDNLHPNDNGHKVIATRMYESIKNGGTENYFNCLFPITITGGSVNNRTYGLLQNGMIVFGNMLVSTSVSSGSNKIGTVHVGMYPQNNVYAPIYKGDRIAGDFVITSSGNIYAIATSAIASPFYVGGINYLPYGGTLN